MAAASPNRYATRGMSKLAHWRGTVRAGDAPIAGVRVSNGRHVAVTDAAGAYMLPAEADARFLMLTTPRGYRADRWYASITDADPRDAVDFALEPDAARDGDSIAIIHATDIHVSVDHDDCDVRNGDSLLVSHHSTGKRGRFALTRWEDLAADLQWIAQREPDAVAFCLTGDLANSGIRPEHDAFARALAAAPLPAHCIPGNHDYMDEQALEKNYEAVLGPRYYSFDIGPVHFLAVDWWELDQYPQRAKRQRAWIDNDLAEQPPERAIVILSHDQLLADFFAPYRDRRILATLSGHRHATRVYDDGATWHVNTPTLMFGAYDHSPRCYRVVRFTDTDVRVETKTLHEDAAAARHTFVADRDAGLSTPATAPVVRTNGAWGQFHGDAGRSGVAPQEVAPPLTVAWTAHLGDALNLGGPAISGDTVIVGLQREDAPGGALVALDAVTGAERWRLPVANSIKRTPAVADGLAIACTVSGELIAADLNTGEVQWRYQLGDPSSCWIYTAPVVVDGVVCLGEAFHFAGVDLSTGEARWVRNDFGQLAEFINMSSPAADGGKVFASFFWQQTNFAALDATTGETIWSHDEGNRRAALGGAVAAHGRVYVSRVHMRLECLDADTGELYWRTRLGSVFSQASPCVTPDTVYAVGGLGKVQALDADTGEPRWQWQAVDALLETAPYMRRTPNTVASPVLAGRFLYVPSNCGRLTALDVEVGEAVWQHEFGAPLPGAPAASGNTLFVPAADGSLTALVSHD